MVKTCKHCSNEFCTNKKQQLYCCLSCQEKAKSKRYYLAGKYGSGICPLCNNNFIKSKRSQQFCSLECGRKNSLIYERPNSLKENYFETIDTKEKAYWLGFLFADGYIKNDCRELQIVIAKEDEDLLKLFSEVIGNDRPLKYYGPYKSNKQIQVHFNLNSPKIVNDLIKHGCTTKKSLTIRFPNFDSEELDLAFLLGFYDGDGSKGSTNLTGGCYEFFKDIKKKWNLKYEISEKSSKYTCYNFSLGIKLFHKMLENFDYGLKRKRYMTGKLTGRTKDNKRISKRLKYQKTIIKERPRKFDPSPSEIENTLKEYNYNMCAIGRHYGVSDNAIRKRCRKYNIIYKK